VCNCARRDCADFMGGCMVTKVQELLRRGREGGAVPEHPQVMGPFRYYLMPVD
jgi:hypothetical protein